MYNILLASHSVIRWLVLAALLIAIYRGWKGMRDNLTFSKADNSLRHWSATIAHIQLMLGFAIYGMSPTVKYFLKTKSTVPFDAFFFGLIHSLLMLAAVVVITIGSAKAKRVETDQQKFRTQFKWFLIGLIIIFIAIPWPFSPLAHRPLIRI